MRRTWVFTIAMAVAVAGCGDAEVDEVPETAEVEVEPVEGEVEYDEELILGPDDVGETIMATGWVSGVPLANGFFLRTEVDRVIFVESDRPVSAGDMVRATGPLMASEVAVFEGWEAEAFEAGFEAEWEVETAYYIDATTVEQM